MNENAQPYTLYTEDITEIIHGSNCNLSLAKISEESPSPQSLQWWVIALITLITRNFDGTWRP